MLSSLNLPIDRLRGIGAKRLSLYQKLGVFTLSDLLHLYPRTYEDWSQPIPIREAPIEGNCCILATVLQEPTAQYIRKNMTLFRFRVSDGETGMTVTLFNATYTARQIRKGEQYLFFGSVTRRGTGFEMSAPQIDLSGANMGIHPIYPQTAGLPSKAIAGAVKQLLNEIDPLLEEEWLPGEIRQKYHLCTARYALQNIHFPKDGEALHIARRRLIFDELFLFRLGLSQMKTRSRSHTGSILRQDHTAEFVASLPFTLTGAQRRAIIDGVRDMKRDFPMSRLVQGDVGSGKTAVAAGLIFSAAKNGMQTAFMAPTEILARQHILSLKKLLGERFPIVLLTASLPAAQKRAALQKLESGEALIAVGTHALLSDKVRFSNLGLVITDEQHRFGVAQRSALAMKGTHPHLLVMSATPIPRTLALMLYGDLDVSVLDELPPGRQPIATYAVDTGKRERVYTFIRRHVDAGKQAYIVCPLVGDGEEPDGDLISATAYYKKLKDGALKGIKTGLLHGQMSGREKEAVMQAFSEGKISVLISTVVIEVGVDVPNAVLMVIENADRFGLAQLHQLRGRVGRGRDPSTCVLISDTESADAINRLKTMCRTADGFEIAEEDLKMRGPGDFFGLKQHGLPQMKLANLLRDMTALKETGEAVDNIVATDPTLSLPIHRGIKEAVKALFTVNENNINN